MNHPVSRIILQLLLDLNMASLPGDSKVIWPCYVSNLPAGDDVPDSAMAVYDTTGMNDGRNHRTKETEVKYGIQIKVRSRSYSKGWARLHIIQKELDMVLRRQVVCFEGTKGTTYLIQCIKRTSPLIPMGPEDKTRLEHFSCNFLITVSQQ